MADLPDSLERQTFLLAQEIVCAAQSSTVRAIQRLLLSYVGAMVDTLTALRESTGAEDLDAYDEYVEEELEEATQVAVDTSPQSLDAVKRQHVVSTIERLGGNKAAASRALGVDRKSLGNMLKRWGYANGRKL